MMKWHDFIGIVLQIRIPCFYVVAYVQLDKILYRHTLTPADIIRGVHSGVNYACAPWRHCTARFQSVGQCVLCMCANALTLALHANASEYCACFSNRSSTQSSVAGVICYMLFCIRNNYMADIQLLWIRRWCIQSSIEIIHAVTLRFAWQLHSCVCSTILTDLNRIIGSNLSTAKHDLSNQWMNEWS